MKNLTNFNFIELLDEFDTAVKALDLGYTQEDWDNGLVEKIFLQRLDLAKDLRDEIFARCETGDLSGVETEDEFNEIDSQLDWLLVKLYAHEKDYEEEVL